MLLIGRISGCFNKKIWETWKRTLFSKLFQKMLYFVYMFIFLNIAFIFENFVLENLFRKWTSFKNFFLQYFLTKSSLYMIVNIFCLSGWEIFAGVCNTDAREKFLRTWCRPEHPKFMFSSYFVSPGRLLLEG